MLTPSPAEGYSLSPPAARGLKNAPRRRDEGHPKQAKHKYSHEYKKQKLSVSDTETDSFLL